MVPPPAAATSRQVAGDPAIPEGVRLLEPSTVEAWAAAYILSDTWQAKLEPAPLPDRWMTAPAPVRLSTPGRGAGFLVRAHGEKSTGKSALLSPERRAKLLHTFLHHELQAAELMAWAVLAFPETPQAFRRGLLNVLADEVRHMQLYLVYLRARGHEAGSFPVRDWFWKRIPTTASPAAFCATMGMGFEAANLDHARRFAARFRSAGDEEAARIEEIVHEEEIPHVRFATHWFERFTATESTTPSFLRWKAYLPAPLSPMVMRGDPLDRDARLRAGADESFVDALEAWTPA